VRELGTKVEPGASVEVDGQKVRAEKPVYYAVHKPKGYVSTNNDPSGRPRVVDLLAEVPERVYAVGRLDEDSTGLMILTNDGELANRLTHPKYGVEKVYRALVAGSPEPDVIDRLTEGVWLSDGKARAKRARFVGKRGEATLVEMVLAEGKNREVRRMLAKIGHKVMSLTRVAVGPVSLKGLKVGQSRHLSGREVDLLQRAAAGEPVPTAQFSDRGDDRPGRPSSAHQKPRRGPAKHVEEARQRRAGRAASAEGLGGLPLPPPGLLPPSKRPRANSGAATPEPPSGPRARRNEGPPAGGGPSKGRRAEGEQARRRKQDREISVGPQEVPRKRPMGPAARRDQGARSGAGPGPAPGPAPRGRRQPPRPTGPTGGHASVPPPRKIIGLETEGPSGPRRPIPRGRPRPERAPKPRPQPRRRPTGEDEE
jgi:23S rRNA pseudouridine2605 synthase